MIKRNIVTSYWANIYIGLRGTDNKKQFPYSELKSECQSYVNEKETCISFVENEYFYKDGSEKGVCITLINYPRFPKSSSEIHNLALELAGYLLLRFNQKRITIVFPSSTIMLENI